MASATLRFYEELNDFLPSGRRKKEFPARFHEGDTVKALIESLGVPHTEVDLILVNGRSVSFAHQVQHGDRITVYPVFESIEIGSITRVRPEALRSTRFVLDVHLGRLAKLLRMLGFDCLYSNSYDDSCLSRISRTERRIVLSRDRELLKRSIITHGYCLRSDKAMDQLLEVLQRFDLREKIRPFSRCLRCNSILKDADGVSVADSVPEYVARTYDHYKSCPDCGRVYWRGSHWEKMRRMLDANL
ncbi:MAG: Mut7-C ubiquitin/RNAse domain-containing protein [Spirochaetaceae bacterium]|nr:MAG: Mut7-C ubiquitin/RNAse domain-containing protein [Spirochaetaceae bacterium]